MTGSSAARKYNGEYTQVERQRELKMVDVKRNPYLIDYQQSQRNARGNYRRSVSKQNENIRRNYTKTQAYKRKQRRAEKRRRLLIRKVALLLICGLILFGALFFLTTLFAKGMAAAQNGMANEKQTSSLRSANTRMQMDETQLIQGLTPTDYGKHPTWTEDFLTPNEYSRPGDALTEINSVFVHYTANPGTSAAQNRSYFEQQKDTHERSVSAHFIIGYEGEIIQCVPLDEIAYAVQTRNNDSVSIECCYLAEDGSFTRETYDSLIKLLQWLVEVYDLDVDEDILRHYDCGGKKCPIYYTEHEDAWEALKGDVKML